MFAILSELAEPVRELAKDKIAFTWGPEHQEVFNMIKKEVAGNSVLAYYNSRKQMTIQTDASNKRLSVCLLQGGTPAYFTSKALTEA